MQTADITLQLFTPVWKWREEKMRRGLNLNIHTDIVSSKFMQWVEQYRCKEENRIQGVWVSAPRPPEGQSLAPATRLHLVCSQRISKSWLPAWKGSFCLCAFPCLWVQSRQGKESTLSFIFMLSHMLFQPSHIVYATVRMGNTYFLFPKCIHLHLLGKGVQTHTYIQHEVLDIFSWTQLLLQDTFDPNRKQGHDQNQSVRTFSLTPAGCSWGSLCSITYSHYY